MNIAAEAAIPMNGTASDNSFRRRTEVSAAFKVVRRTGLEDVVVLVLGVGFAGGRSRAFTILNVFFIGPALDLQWTGITEKGVRRAPKIKNCFSAFFQRIKS